MNEPATMTNEQHLLQIMELIRQSRVIPDDQKKKYIESIQGGNFTEQTADELSKTFEQDAQLLDQEISESQQGLKDLEEEVSEEQAQIDVPQAKLLAALEDFHEREEQHLSQTLEGMEKDLETMEESAQEEGEKEAEAAIRAKLQQK